jgi:hypothetical protein
MLNPCCFLRMLRIDSSLAPPGFRCAKENQGTLGGNLDSDPSAASNRTQFRLYGRVLNLGEFNHC